MLDRKEGLPSPYISNNLLICGASRLNLACPRYVAVKGDSMTNPREIKKRITKSFRYGLYASLIFFILALACNGQNENNTLKSNNKTSKSNIQNADGTEISQQPGRPQPYVPHEVLVKFNPDTDPQIITRIQTELKLEKVRKFHSPNLFLMKITDGTSVEAIIKILKTYDEVKYAEPNYVVKANP
jgi:hypothetical protein